MTNIVQHTPTPWKTNLRHSICSQDGINLATVRFAKDRTFIIKAINCHDELVTALKYLMQQADEDTPFELRSGHFHEALDWAKDALASVEGR